MKIVIDGLPIGGGSLALVVQNLLRGWQELGESDELHLLTGTDAHIEPVPGVHIQRFQLGGRGARLKYQNLAVRRYCLDVGADAMLGSLPTTTIVPLPCPRAVIAYDLRHELRKEQFSRRFRMKRALGYGAGFRQADGIACISSGTRDDLLASRRWLRPDRVTVSLLGADHVLNWKRATVDATAPYVLAFGQYGNKNVRTLLEAWRILRSHDVDLPLHVVGLRPKRFPETQAFVDEQRLGDSVTLYGWLSDEDFQRQFTGAAMVVFPSNFEGFGMPAVEAMRLGIPLVITPERTLLAVTGGLATTAQGWTAADIAEAVETAIPLIGKPPSDEVVEWAETFTWRRTAASVRSLLVELVRGG